MHQRLALATAGPRGAALRHRLQTGTTSLYRACAIATATAHLPADAVAPVVEAVLRPPRDGSAPSPTLFRQRLGRAVLAAEAATDAALDAAAGDDAALDDAGARRRAARRRRKGAYARLDPDGLGTLTVINDADKIVAAIDRAEDVARAARAAGDPRSLDALRADFLTDTAIFGWPNDTPPPPAHAPTDGPGAAQADATADGSAAHPTADGSAHAPADGTAHPPAADPEPVRPGGSFAHLGRRPAGRVWIVVPFTTATGADHTPCELPGHGWVTAEHARQIITNDESTWQRLAVDLDTGAALQLHTDAYRPTPAMRAHVEAVDGVCRGPGCHIPANRCDLDHDTPWPRGQTTPTDLSAKHRRHHNLRTTGAWTAHRAPTGHRPITWRTITGRTYITWPKDWLEAHRQQPHHDAAAAPTPNQHQQPPPPPPDEPPF